MALGAEDDFVVHLWRSISLLLVSYIPNLSWSFVPKAQPIQAVFLGWDYFLKTIFLFRVP